MSGIHAWLELQVLTATMIMTIISDNIKTNKVDNYIFLICLYFVCYLDANNTMLHFSTIYNSCNSYGSEC